MTRKQKGYKITKDDKILGCWCSTAHGPGWSNYFIQVVVINREGKFRIEWIQPEEMSKDILILFDIGKEVHNSLTNLVENLVRKR